MASSTTLGAHRLRGDQHVLCWVFRCPYQAILVSPCRLHIRVHATNLFLGCRLESFDLRDRGTEAPRSPPRDLDSRPCKFRPSLRHGNPPECSETGPLDFAVETLDPYFHLSLAHQEQPHGGDLLSFPILRKTLAISALGGSIPPFVKGYLWGDVNGFGISIPTSLKSWMEHIAGSAAPASHLVPRPTCRYATPWP